MARIYDNTQMFSAEIVMPHMQMSQEEAKTKTSGNKTCAS